tara:strand:+ start:738 stop:1127 length:390 start_codon:yes stop_codon:yes gene_type:complete
MELINVGNNKEYSDFIRNLRNHEEVKGGFIQQKHIDEKEHESHMTLYSYNYYVCIIEGQPAGYVGQIRNDIRVATHPDFQGRGVGKFMINQLMEMHSDAFAKVKLENEASIKLFEACGFKKKYYILEKQ